MNPTLIISVDGMNSRFLGAYGNSWVPTPVIDALASGSVLFDNCFCETTDVQRNLVSLISGEHPLLLSDFPGRSIVPGEAVLVTDDPGITESMSRYFDDVLLLPGPFEEESESGSTYGKLFEFAFAEISSRIVMGQMPAIWVHSRGMFGDWEAPLELQEFFKDEEDRPPCRIGKAPGFQLDDACDPDERTLVVHAYAAEVVEFDQSLGQFLEILEKEIGLFDVTLIGTRGFALGEHLEVGDFNSTCYAEKFHVPCISFQHGLKTSIRIPSLLGISEVAEILWDKELGKGGGEIEVSKIIDWNSRDHKVLTLQSSGFARIQTTAWSYMHPLDASGYQLDSECQGELFARLYDRLELNEISTVCSEICKELMTELSKRLGNYASGMCPEKSHLSDLIYTGIS